MNEQHRASRPSLLKRLWFCVTGAFRPALRSCMWLLVILIPVSFFVAILSWSGILGEIAELFEPVFRFFGLPGESALVFLTSCLSNIYSAIAVMEMISISTRASAILALMCLICHSLFIETAVQKKTGSSITGMILTRLGTAFAGAFILNMIIPGKAEPAQTAAVMSEHSLTFGQAMKEWAISAGSLSLKIVILVTLLMILQRFLKEFSITRFLSWVLRHPLRLFGLPVETAFLWIVSNTLGLTYGSAVLIEEVDSGRLNREHADILNYHIAISHSLLEDTLLFVAVGVSAWWITIPRVILAGAVVWLRRAILFFFEKNRNCKTQIPNNK